MVEVSPASDYCQRWSEGNHTWRHRSQGGFDPSLYTVAAIDESVAKTYVTTHHYSHSYPSASQRYGLFEDEQLRGVLVLGVPAQASVLTNVFPNIEPYVGSLELSRLVLADQVAANGESWFIARCFEEAAAGGLRAVVSFADPVPRIVAGRVLFPGHIGTIYQASNAHYSGRGTARTLTVLPSGEVLNARSMQKVRAQDRGHEYVEQKLLGFGGRPMRAGEKPNTWLARTLDDIGVTRIRHGGCFRYAFTLGNRRQRRQVEMGLPSLAYPKTLAA